MSDSAYDVVVAGAGSAGLPAAIMAADRGGRVCLIEAAGEVGGTLLISRGQMSGAGTRLQAERGIEDSAERHFDDAMRASRGGSDPEFLALATRLQGPFIDCLVDHGYEVVAGAPRGGRGGGPTTPRTYWGPQAGRSILEVLVPMLEAHVAAGRIDLRLNTRLADLIVEDGRVAGVTTGAGDVLRAGAVVLTTGGYAANPELFARLHDGAPLWSGSYAHATGTGLELALMAGGVLVQTDKFMPSFGGVLDPTVQPPRYRAPGGLDPEARAPWEILVNREGRRFHPEDSGHAEARAAALARQSGSQGWLIYDAAIRAEAPTLFSHFPDKADAFYGPGGPVVAADSLPELAQRCGIAADALADTVSDYNRAVETGEDRLGRRHVPRPIGSPPFYALPIAAYSVRSMGGLKVDTHMRVLDAQERPIPGLYAAGEILGGLLSGRGGVGGMSLTPALAFGKYLGELIPLGQGAGS